MPIAQGEQRAQGSDGPGQLYLYYRSKQLWANQYARCKGELALRGTHTIPPSTPVCGNAGLHLSPRRCTLERARTACLHWWRSIVPWVGPVTDAPIRAPGDPQLWSASRLPRPWGSHMTASAQNMHSAWSRGL
eukprot:scaffold357_cov400-Prasinococcus_capsulatus_cf.AAC.4